MPSFNFRRQCREQLLLVKCHNQLFPRGLQYLFAVQFQQPRALAIRTGRRSVMQNMKYAFEASRWTLRNSLPACQAG